MIVLIQSCIATIRAVTFGLAYQIAQTYAVLLLLLTTVGGAKNGQDSNKLYSLKEGGAWVEEFPPMPTRRSSATAIYTESSLIVVGGYGLRSLVEVMSIASRQWSIAAAVLTYEVSQCPSVVVCGDQLYVLGTKDSKSVYTCSVTDLLQSCQPTSEKKVAPPRQSNKWTKLADLPLYHSTCVSLCGHLLAIGGSKSAHNLCNSSKAVYAYKPANDSWEVISHSMSVPRRQSLLLPFLPITT